MQADKNYPELEKFCRQLGVDLFGVADVKEIKNEFAFSAALLEKMDRAICLGMRLNDLVMEDIADAPTRLYSYHYRTVNLLLDQIALKTTAYINKNGYLALPVPASQVLDWQKHTAHLSHRKIAYLAGLGWIGRNNLLVHPEFGSRLRLVTILTDMPLEPGAPIKENCRDCRRCVEVCPAGAIKDGPADFDRAACLAKLKEFQKKHIVEQYICGVCVRACRGKRTEKGTAP